ncbi:MAG: hypothetical protein ABUT20_29235 [Bacteroidota bacterium]
MKKIFLLLTGAALFVACNNEKKTDTPAAETTEAPAVTLPYTPNYSSSFTIGKAEYSAKILQGSWKDWEMNTMDNMKNWVADTILAFRSDNSIVKGVDSLQARWKRGRAGYTTVIDTIHSVLSTHSTDKNEDWVLVWAKEINTDTKGKIDTVELMETWRINKDGKADRLYQYDRHARKQ